MHARQELRNARERLLDLCLQMQKAGAERFGAVSLSEAVAAVRALEAKLHALQQFVKRQEDDERVEGLGLIAKE